MEKAWWTIVRQDQQLQVEVYAHGGWWKDSSGRTGQVVPIQANKGPLATVAVLANGFGLEGWTLVDVISAQHNTYRLSFEPTPDTTAVAESDAADQGHPPKERRASISSG
jgi:hypothetical protein